MKYNIAVLGATGLVGLDVLWLLANNNLSINKVYAIASQSSDGKVIKFRDENLIVNNINNFDFSLVNIVICCLDNALSSIWVPFLSKKGIMVIDNSSCFRYDADIPLIIPQINSQDISLVKNRNIIANPNCSTIIMLLGIYNILTYYSVKRVIVSTYQSVSGAGINAINNFDSDYANKCIPMIDILLQDNSSKEEYKMVQESKKILSNPLLAIHSNCARVPILYGHCMFVNIEFKDNIDLELIEDIIKKDNNLIYYEKSNYPNQKEIQGSNYVHIARLKRDTTIENGISLWILGDNIRIGASLNAVNILKLLIK